MSTWLLTFFAAGAAYFYFNWQFLALADECFGKKTSVLRAIGVFVLNYAVFTGCSLLQLHLIANWSIFFCFLMAEIHIIYRQSWIADIYMALNGVLNGLAVNIILRCAFALFMNKPLMLFDNQTLMSENLKRYPVLLGFILAGVIFHAIRKSATGSKIKQLAKDRSSLTFLVRLTLVLYVYLILNLLTYYTDGNDLVFKLWGIKSACFAILGFYLASFYSFRMSRLNYYADLNRKEREALLQEKQDDEKLRIIAYTDLLTGCYNRQYADDILQELWEKETPFCVCFVDLNGLKEVNDQYGHLEGDQYLITVAKTVKKYIRQQDLFFRYGGDEFLVLFMEANETVPMQRMYSINKELVEYGKERNSHAEISISWGVAHREEASDIAKLLQMADERMYRNKQEIYKGRKN